MRHFIIATAWFCGLTTSALAPAVAQTTDPQPPVEQRIPNPDPNQPDAPTPVPVVPRERFTREQAEALLAESGAANVFEIIPRNDDNIGLRHRSGMVCRFTPGGNHRINTATSQSVGCVDGPWPQTLTAAIRQRMQLPIATGAMEDTFREEFPNARAFDPPADLWPAPSRNVRFTHLIARSDQGEINVIHAVAIQRGNWTIMGRYTYASESDMVTMAAELAAVGYFRTILSDLEN